MDLKKQTAVNAVLDMVESDDAARFDLPIPMTGMMFGELRDLKVTRTRTPRAPAPGQRITVVDGKTRRPATEDEERAFAGAADAMMRSALLKAGWSEKALVFWFTADPPVDLQAYARERRRERG